MISLLCRYVCKSLRLKVWLAIQMITCLIIILYLIFQHTIHLKTTKQIVEAQGILLAQELIHSTFHRMENLAGNKLEHALQPGNIPKETVTLRITDPQKQIRYSNIAEEIGRNVTIPDAQPPIPALDSSLPNLWQTRIDHDKLILTSPLWNEKRCQYCHREKQALLGYAEAILSTQDIFKEFRQSQWISLWGSACLFITLSIVSWLIIRRLMVDRIQSLSNAMQHIAQGDFKVRVQDPSGDEIGLLSHQFNSMMEEISSSREREIERHRQEISQFDRLATIGELVSGLAHEIRNPVAGIRAAIQTLSRCIPAEDPTFPIYQEIQTTTSRLDTLVRSLLSFARMEKPHFQPLDINEIVEETLILFQSHDGKDCKINKDLANRIPMVKGDAKLLQQVLLNLLNNAQQAKEKDLELKITSCFQSRQAQVHRLGDGLEESAYRCSGGVIQVRISDNGPGIPPMQLYDIFRPFFTTKKHGTGLGLSISTRIVREHHGCLFAQNNPDRGATFVICLPTEIHKN